MPSVEGQQGLDTQIPNRSIQHFLDSEKPDKHFQHVYATDKGKGYKAVDIVTNISYIAIVILFFYQLWVTIHFPTTMFTLILFPVYVLIVYISRLIVRAIFAWRDKTSDEMVE